MDIKELKKVTKDYKTILKSSKKLTKNILTTIINTNLTNLTIVNDTTTNLKLIVTREQKDDLKRLATDFLKVGLDYNNLTNKQLYKAILYSFKGNYTRVANDKVSVTYGFKDVASVMDFWRYVGWQLLGDQTTEKKGNK